MCSCIPGCFSRVQLFAVPWTIAHQAPLSLGFSRQEHWSRLLCPPPGDLQDQGPNPCLLQLLHYGGFFTTEAPGKPIFTQLNQLLLKFL